MNFSGCGCLLFLPLPVLKSKKISIAEGISKRSGAAGTNHRSPAIGRIWSILKKQILPELAENHIWLYYDDPIRSEHKETVREYFLSKVLSFLQPIILRKENQADVFLDNNALYFIVDMEAADQPGIHTYALLNIPSANLPRFSELPMLGDDHYILFLDDVIRENLQEVFPALYHYMVHGV